MTDGIKDWDPELIIQLAFDKMEANADDAGQFVVDEARRRLQAIQEPEWGAGYRRGVVANLLAYEVDRLGDEELTIWVGVESSDESSHHGFYIELGSSKFPAHPFLRPAIFENGNKILGLLLK